MTRLQKISTVTLKVPRRRLDVDNLPIARGGRYTVRERYVKYRRFPELILLINRVSQLIIERTMIPRQRGVTGEIAVSERHDRVIMSCYLLMKNSEGKGCLSSALISLPRVPALYKILIFHLLILNPFNPNNFHCVLSKFLSQGFSFGFLTV
jgi:hypothetical protein